MFGERDGAGDTAIGYADDFAEAAVAKLDGLFGNGYAERNPAAFAAYVAACAQNLNSFMVAATAIPNDLSEALASFGEMGLDLADPPPSKPKGKRGR